MRSCRVADPLHVYFPFKIKCKSVSPYACYVSSLEYSSVFCLYVCVLENLFLLRRLDDSRDVAVANATVKVCATGVHDGIRDL